MRMKTLDEAKVSYSLKNKMIGERRRHGQFDFDLQLNETLSRMPS